MSINSFRSCEAYAEADGRQFENILWAELQRKNELQTPGGCKLPTQRSCRNTCRSQGHACSFLPSPHRVYRCKFTSQLCHNASSICKCYYTTSNVKIIKADAKDSAYNRLWPSQTALLTIAGRREHRLVTLNNAPTMQQHLGYTNTPAVTPLQADMCWCENTVHYV